MSTKLKPFDELVQNMQLSHVTQSDLGQAYRVFQNLFILGEGEHLHGEAFVVRRDSNPGVAHDRMEDRHIAVITVRAAKRTKRHLNTDVITEASQ